MVCPPCKRMNKYINHITVVDKMQSYLHLFIRALNTSKSLCERNEKKDDRKCVICPLRSVREKKSLS